MALQTPPPPAPNAYKIVVGVDYSELSNLALQTALSLALERDGQIVALAVAEGHVPNRPEQIAEEVEERFLVEAQETLERHLGEQIAKFESTGLKLNRKRVGAAVDIGTPADCLLNLARNMDADLVVVGTHGRKGLKRLVVGSVATAVLRGAHCSVMVVRPRDHSD
jgi:nucleotide-binding universal stress UspA family protein